MARTIINLPLRNSVDESYNTAVNILQANGFKEVSYNGETYTFTVESYLCDNSTDVYKAVTSLEIGQTVDMEGFLYWYEGANPHITSVKVAE